MNVNIDKFGRVIIPKNLRDELALEEGSPLTVEVIEGSVVLKPDRRSPLREKHGVLVFCGEPEAKITRSVETDRLRRIRKAGKLRRK